MLIRRKAPIQNVAAGIIKATMDKVLSSVVMEAVGSEIIVKSQAVEKMRWVLETHEKDTIKSKDLPSK